MVPAVHRTGHDTCRAAPRSAADSEPIVSVSPHKQPVRADIEGLRAVAVLSVVAHHAYPDYLSGGFIGVDIFFVISGYLIGMHLLQDIGAGEFSFIRFYARRARRLFPALAVVLAAAWGFGWVILSPLEFAALGRHVLAAALFSNNVLLWLQSGYFDTASAAKPLLHLWSLGVEEQFYLLVPVLLWASSRGLQGSIAWVVRLSMLSFLLTELAAAPSFYLLSTRFWELGAGVALGSFVLNASRVAEGAAPLTRSSARETVVWVAATLFAGVLLLGSKYRSQQADSWLATCGALAALALAIVATQVMRAYRQPDLWVRLRARARQHEIPLREVLGVAGLALIGISIWWVEPAGWPGPQTLFPVLGTAMVILAGARARTNVLLGVRPLAFVGGISYPLYLWHWPLIVYWRMLGYSASVGGELIAVLIALVLAWATKELIEEPARFGRVLSFPVGRPRLRTVCGALVATGALGLASIANSGYPSRFPPSLSAIADWSIPQADAAWRLRQCYFYPGQTDQFAAQCTPTRRAGVPRVLLWGDSHAAQLYPGLIELRKRSDFDLVQWTAAGCPPTRVRWFAEEPGCDGRRAWALAQMRALAPDTVILAARWELYLARGITQHSLVTAVADDIRWLRSLGVRRIVVFGPGPAWNASLPMDLFRYMSLRRTALIPERLGGVPEREQGLDHALAAEAVIDAAEYVSVLDWFCNSSGCRTLGNESEHHPDLLFRDQDHLTPSGSRDLLRAAADKVLVLQPHF